MLRRTAHYQLKSSWMGQADLKMACHLLCSTHGNCDDLVPACAYEYRPYFWPGRSSLQWIFGEVSEYFPGAHFPWQFSDSGQLFLQSIGKHSLATALILFRKIHCLGSRAADFGRAVRIDGLPCAGVLSSLLIGILFLCTNGEHWQNDIAYPRKQSAVRIGALRIIWERLKTALIHRICHVWISAGNHTTISFHTAHRRKIFEFCPKSHTNPSYPSGMTNTNTKAKGYVP